MVKVGYRTDVGKTRSKNEDAILVLPKYNIFAVADGVGGQNSGEIASRKAVVSIEDFLKKNPIGNVNQLDGKYRINWLRSYFLRCFQKINADILGITKREPDKDGMATTAVVAYLDESFLYVINIGDSRAYIVRDGEISQLTEDHTYVNNLINAGTLTKSEARDHPEKNVITKALGAGNVIEPDFFHYDIQDGDRVLLCTDGLHGELTDEEINDIMQSSEDLNKVCKALVKAANEKDGSDNISVVLFRI